MEILSQNDILTIDPSCARLAFRFFLAFLLAAVLSIIISYLSELGAYVAFGVALFSGIIALLIFLFSPQIDTGRDKYEVILDETIDINEFYDEYEVIERRDKIWVIEDKEAKDNANS